MRKIATIILSIFVLMSLIISIIGIFLNFYISPIPVVESVNINDRNELIIKYDIDSKKYRNKIYYLLKTDNSMPKINDNWILSKNNEISINMDKNIYYVYLKNEDNKIVKVNNTENLGKITSININKEKVYVAVNGEYKVNATYDSIGKINDEIKWYSEDESIAKVDENGKITGIKKGTTKVYAEIMNEKVSSEVIVTNLITVRPNKFNSKKSYLPCGKYSKEHKSLGLRI